jgi:hypothetical protein
MDHCGILRRKKADDMPSQMKALRRLLAALSLLMQATLATGATPDAARNEPYAVNGKVSQARPFMVGVGSAIRWGASTVGLAGELGVNSIRTDAPWKLIELQRGQFAIPAWLEQWVDRSLASGLSPLLILGYGNPLYSRDKPRTPEEVEAFKRYAVFVMTRFKSRVRTYELWNEWNNKTGDTTPGDPESYIRFARQVVPALREVDPLATIVAQGVSPGGLRGGWLDKFLELGGAQAFDGVSLHPYSWSWKKDRSPEAAMRLVDGYQRAAARHNGGKPVDFYITEMGWPSFDEPLGENQDAVGAFLARFLLMARCRPYIKGVWWHTLIDDGTDPANSEHHYGLFDLARKPKPAATAMRETASLISDSSLTCSQSTQGEDVTLQLSGKRKLQAFWQGGDIAPGGARFQTRPRERVSENASAPQGSAALLFQPAVSDFSGVPRVRELQP